MAGGWYKRGFKNEEMETQRGRGPRRYWMPPGKKNVIVFLDEDPFALYEHQLKIGDTFQNWYTCLSNFEKDCPLCDAGDNPMYVAALTILRGYEDQYGTPRVIKELFVMKQKTWNVMKNQAEKRKGLTGARYEVFRGTDKDANVGSQFDFEEKVDPLDEFAEQLKLLKNIKPEQYLKPFDYEKVFEPFTTKELERVARKIGGGARKVASGHDDREAGDSREDENRDSNRDVEDTQDFRGGVADDDIPF